jgi:chromosome segregation ATPase
MSTAGKVLIVLILLVLPIWIVMFSAVAELNKNGTQAVQDLKEKVVKLEEDVARNEHEIFTLKDQISLEQRAMGEQITVLRSRQSDAEKARAELTEIQKRVKYQLAGIETALKNAQTTRDVRDAEKKTVTKEIADTEDEVKKLQEEHAELTAQLERLRSEFKETLESNRAMADRLSKASNKPGS